jgi:hypothetical protein
MKIFVNSRARPMREGDNRRGPAFDSRSYQTFSEVVGLDQGPISLVMMTEELIRRNNGCSGI